MKTIEEVTKTFTFPGWRQVLNEEDIENKKIYLVVREYSDLYILFIDHTFVHYDTTVDDDYIDFNNIIISYNVLFNRIYRTSSKEVEYELTNLGKAMNANIAVLKKYDMEERVKDKEVEDALEYQYYLKLKAKYENNN